MYRQKNKTQPFLFSKLDISDGFWRGKVRNEDRWNFCYILPSEIPEDINIEDIDIVVSSSLQMGWTESPQCFCATTETARDIAEELINNNISVQPHPREHLCCPPKHWTKIKDHGTICINFISQLEVYVDDFIMITQVSSSKELVRFSRSLLHAIHMVFPPLIITKHDGKDPISVKKVEQGDGIWKYRKTVLGWIFDGLSRCLSLPKEKVEEITLEVKVVGRKKHIPLLRFQKKLENSAMQL